MTWLYAIKLRATAERPSSPAAGSRSEARAQAVGGRVQRLVVLRLVTLDLFELNKCFSQLRGIPHGTPRYPVDNGHQTKEQKILHPARQ